MARVHVFVAGHVQGVLFRESARRQAAGLELRGWIRNLGDGRVEAVAEGELDRLRRFVAWCHQGPTGARVVGVEAKWNEPEQAFDSFQIRR